MTLALAPSLRELSPQATEGVSPSNQQLLGISLTPYSAREQRARYNPSPADAGAASLKEGGKRASHFRGAGAGALVRLLFPLDKLVYNV